MVWFRLVRRNAGSGHSGVPRHVTLSPRSSSGMGYLLGHPGPVPIAAHNLLLSPCQTRDACVHPGELQHGHTGAWVTAG